MYIRKKLLFYLTFEESLILIRILVASFIVWVHEIEVLPEHVRKLVDPLIHLETSQPADPLSPFLTWSLGAMTLSLCHCLCVIVMVSVSLCHYVIVIVIDPLPPCHLVAGCGDIVFVSLSFHHCHCVIFIVSLCYCHCH